LYILSKAENKSKYYQFKRSLIMKTFFISLTIAAGLLVFAGCQKEAEDLTTPALNQQEDFGGFTTQSAPGVNWTNNFNSEADLTKSFYLLGDPLPVWVASAFNREGLFDNMGASPDPGYGISKSLIGIGGPIEIESEVYLSITSTNGYCVCPGLGITQKTFYPGQPPAHLQEVTLSTYFRFMYAGYDATWVPSKYRGHAWIQAGYMSDGNKFITLGDYIVSADKYANGWHKIKISVTQEHSIRFYIDNVLIWAPANGITYKALKAKNLVMGFTSSGLAGKAYHNYVKVSYPDIN